MAAPFNHGLTPGAPDTHKPPRRRATAPPPQPASSTELEPYNCRAPHTPQIVETALLTCAMVGGSDEHASKLLATKGVTVNRKTLRDWRTRYPNRYRELCERHKAEIEGEITSTVRSLVLRASHVAQQALDLEEQRIAAGEVNDAASSLRNISTTIGIGVDKILLMEGRPTAITEQRSSDDVLRGLQDKGYVDSTLVEDKP